MADDKIKDSRGDILQITFHYENVTESLVGSEAKRWLDMVNGMCNTLHAISQIKNPFQNEQFKWIPEVQLDKDRKAK